MQLNTLIWWNIPLSKMNIDGSVQNSTAALERTVEPIEATPQIHHCSHQKKLWKDRKSCGFFGNASTEFDAECWVVDNEWKVGKTQSQISVNTALMPRQLNFGLRLGLILHYLFLFTNVRHWFHLEHFLVICFARVVYKSFHLQTRQ